MAQQIRNIEGGSWWVEKWDVESKSTSGKFYRVARNKKGEFGCNCAQWKFRRQRCNHIKQVIDRLPELENLPVIPAPRLVPKHASASVELKAIEPGAAVWAVVQRDRQAIRIKGIVVNVDDNCTVQFKSNRTGREYEVPLHLVFAGRPDKAILETAYV